MEIMQGSDGWTSKQVINLLNKEDLWNAMTTNKTEELSKFQKEIIFKILKLTMTH